MKKVVSVHLGGRVFQIEEDAYVFLDNTLNGQWRKQELEIRIAERLEQKFAGGRSVVTRVDVADVLYQLGVSASTFRPEEDSLRSKKLYRKTGDKVIAGVCAGLGDYFEIDPVIMRVLFVAAFFMGSMGFWLYIILWIIVPKAPKSLYA